MDEDIGFKHPHASAAAFYLGDDNMTDNGRRAGLVIFEAEQSR